MPELFASLWHNPGLTTHVLPASLRADPPPPPPLARARCFLTCTRYTQPVLAVLCEPEQVCNHHAATTMQPPRTRPGAGSSLYPSLSPLYLSALQTWSGLLATRADSCVVAALQLQPHAGSLAPLWEVRELRHDVASLLPLSSPTGGVLAFSDHAVLWLSHSSRFGLALDRDGRCAATPLLTACGEAAAQQRINLQGTAAAASNSEIF